MGRAWVVVALLAGCGRIGFAPTGASGDGGDVDGNGDGARDTGMTIDASLPTGAYAHYPLGDDFSAMSMALDVTGNGHHMTCAVTSCPAQGLGRPGGSATSALFDGTNDYLGFLPTMGSADFPQFTVAAWIRLARRPSDFEMIVGRPFGGSAENSFALDHTSTGQIEYFSQGGSSLFANSAALPSVWTHVAISYDGLFKRVYVRGTLGGSASQGGPTYDGNGILIGADITSATVDHFFQGQIADVMIFDRALSNAEVLALAQ